MDDASFLQLRFGDFELNESNARLSSNGRPVPLTPKAFAVLCALARRPGHLVTKSDLLDAAWGHQHVSESVLKTIVSELRGALGDDARQPRFIETASRRGYRLIAYIDPPPPAPRFAPELVREPDEEGTPTPSAARFVGRQRELARALAAWDRVVKGGRNVVFVAGEAGIGKTTLIDRLLERCGSQRVGRGQCVEHFGAAEPYLPVLEALGSLCRDDPSLQLLMRSVAPSWLLQMPWLSTEAERSSLQRELVGSHPDRMLRELEELFDRCSRQQPLLLVTEDLHWADHATVRLLDHFARSRRPARVMWLSSFRPSDAIVSGHPLTDLRHELRAKGLGEEILLDPFSEREVADYLADRFAGAAAIEPFARSLHTNTEGLPLFVANVVDDLLARGVITEGPVVDLPETVSTIPQSVAGMPERRFGRLPADAQTLLEAASVCGVEFGCEALGSAVGEVERGRVVERCEALTHEGYLAAVDLLPLADGSLDARYRFQHALYRHVLYARIGAHAKASLHRRVARWLADSPLVGEPSAAEIALHFELGREPLPAARHYVDAADKALDCLARVEAVQLIDRAMALLRDCPPNHERLQLELLLLARRGIAHPLIAGLRSAEGAAAFERARTLCNEMPPTPERALVMTGLGWVFWARGDYASARPLAERAIAIGTERDDPAVVATASDLAGNSMAHQGELVGARNVLERGIEACAVASGRFPRRLLRPHDPEVSLRSVISLPLGRLGFVDQARRHKQAALERAERLNQPLALLHAYWYAAIAEALVDEIDAVSRRADSLLRIFREAQMLTCEAPGLWFQGLAQARSGDPEGGHALIEMGIASYRRLGRNAGITHAFVLAAEAMVLAGQWARAHAHVDEGLRIAEGTGERVYTSDLLMLRARAAQGMGQPAQAHAALLEAWRVSRSQQARWLELAASTALCEIENGRDEYLPALREARGRSNEGSNTALVARADGLLESAFGANCWLSPT